MKKLWILILPLFSACYESFVKEIPYPEVEPKLTVFCLLERGYDSVYVKVHESQLIFGPDSISFGWPQDNELIENASVSLFHPSGKVYTSNTLVQDMGYLIVLDDKIKEGESYRLEVRGPDGKTVKSNTHIPYHRIQNMDIGLDSILTESPFISRKINVLLFSIGFKDDAAENSYYDIYGNYSSPTDPNFEWQFRFEQRFALISDKNRNGEDVTINTGTGDYYNISDLPSGRILNTETGILSVTKDYYLYHNSLNNVNDFYDENPFAEPTIIHTNIEGGLGLFSGLSKKVFQHTLERE